MAISGSTTTMVIFILYIQGGRLELDTYIILGYPTVHKKFWNFFLVKFLRIPQGLRYPSNALTLYIYLHVSKKPGFYLTLFPL